VLFRLASPVVKPRHILTHLLHPLEFGLEQDRGPTRPTVAMAANPYDRWRCATHWFHVEVSGADPWCVSC
jgi:hypothetical protein